MITVCRRGLLVLAATLAVAGCSAKEKEIAVQQPKVEESVPAGQSQNAGAAKGTDSARNASAEADASNENAGQQAAVQQKAPPAKPRADSDIVILETRNGRIVIQLRSDLAPKHAEQIKKLVKRGFYDGVVFHRVIDGFMAQTGDPTGTGSGGSDLPDLPAEFSSEPFERGTVGMARSQDPNSANSQFFIMFAPAPHLNGQYTVIGQVTKGMEVVDLIKKGDPASNGQVSNPDKIIKMSLQ
jgi:peptidylprolyl isomerase